MTQSVAELKKRAKEVDLWDKSTDETQCDNCRYYREMKEGIGYCAHKEVDMVVGAPWWCKLYAPKKK